MRNLVVLGCAALLASGLVLTTFAQEVPDTDGDGILDPNDNCVIVPNGPLASTDECDDQEDGDRDGYGNPCDYDYNNNGSGELNDVYDALVAAKAVSTDNKYDNNCNGAADLEDVKRALEGSSLVAVPGPSGLACAGTVPCP